MLARRGRFGFAEDYASLRQIVGGDLHAHTVAGNDSDEVFSHLAGDMSKHNMPVRQFQPEHRARQDIDHNSFSNNRLFFSHRENAAFTEDSARNQPIAQEEPKFGVLPGAT